MDKERKLPHGEAKHRRKVLADARRKEIFDLDKKIIEKDQAGQRLARIEELLSPGNKNLSDLNPLVLEQTRTGLEIERIWLQYRLEIITQPQRQQLLNSVFDELEQNSPGIYQWLFLKNEHELCMAERIRDKVIPPKRVAGYYTKR